MSDTAVKELTPKLEGIYKEVTGLTVLELAELVKAMEDRLGIQAAAPVAMVAGGGAAAGAAAPAEEKTSFDVILKEVDAAKKVEGHGSGPRSPVTGSRPPAGLATGSRRLGAPPSVAPGTGRRR